jgi:hypothetical protein
MGVESFNKTLRDEMDIEELRERLVSVVQETMQPAFVTLWLRQTERQEKVLDDGLKDHLFRAPEKLAGYPLCVARFG